MIFFVLFLFFNYTAAGAFETRLADDGWMDVCVV